MDLGVVAGGLSKGGYNLIPLSHRSSPLAGLAYEPGAQIGGRGPQVSDQPLRDQLGGRGPQVSDRRASWTFILPSWLLPL